MRPAVWTLVVELVFPLHLCWLQSLQLHLFCGTTIVLCSYSLWVFDTWVDVGVALCVQNHVYLVDSVVGHHVVKDLLVCVAHQALVAHIDLPLFYICPEPTLVTLILQTF